MRANTTAIPAVLLLVALSASLAAVTVDFTQDGSPLLTAGTNTTPATYLNADDALYYNITSTIAPGNQYVTNPSFTVSITAWNNNAEDNAPGSTNSFAQDTAVFNSTPASGQKIIMPTSVQDFLRVGGTADAVPNATLDQSTTNVVSWAMKFNSLTNPGNAQDAEVCAEAFGTIGGTASRRLYWCLVVDGALPADTADIKYIQVGNGASTAWQSFSRDIGDDILTKFGATTYSIDNIKLVNTMLTGNIPNNAARPQLSSNFDDIYVVNRAYVKVTHNSTNNVTIPAGYQAVLAQASVKLKSNSTTPTYTLKWLYNNTFTTAGCSASQTIGSADVTLNCTDTANPGLAVSGNTMQAQILTSQVDSMFITSENLVRYRIGYPNLTTANLTPSSIITVNGTAIDTTCNFSVDQDFAINDTQTYIEWRPVGGNFTNMTTSSANSIYLNASTPTNPYINASVPAGGFNTSNWTIVVKDSGSFEIRCRAYSPSAGQVYSSNVSVSSLPTTFYEHLAYPGSIFNQTSPIGVQRSTTLSTNPFSGENLFAVFDRDVIESGAGAVLSPQTVAFEGYFNMLTNPKRVRLDWQLLDYDTVNLTEVEICRTPNATSGVLISKGGVFPYGASCSISTTYTVPPGHRLRVKIFLYNNVASVENVTHMWDTAQYDSKYSLGVISGGALSVDLVSPPTDQTLAVSQVFNATCQANCTGTCPNANAYIEVLQPGWSNFTPVDANTSRNLVLASGESNPHSLGLVSGAVNTTFSLKANLISTGNTLRCRATSGGLNPTGPTTRNVSIAASKVNTSQASYAACGTLVYLFQLWDANDQTADSNATISLYNTTMDLFNSTTKPSSSGTVSGFFVLPSIFDRGEWLIEAIADGTLYKLPVIVGTGSTDYYRVDLSITPNKAVYNSTEQFTAAATVWNLKGNGVSGLTGGNFVIKVDNSPYGGTVNDQGNGTYVFNVSTAGLPTNNQHYVDVTAGPNPQMTARRGFYVIP